MHVCSLWEKKFGRQANHIKVREKEPRRIGREPPFKQPHTSDTGWSAHPPRAATRRNTGPHAWSRDPPKRRSAVTRFRRGAPATDPAA